MTGDSLVRSLRTFGVYPSLEFNLENQVVGVIFTIPVSETEDWDITASARTYYGPNILNQIQESLERERAEHRVPRGASA